MKNNDVPETLVTTLIDAWPESTKQTDAEGNTVLHTALNDMHTPGTVMVKLINACPSVAELKYANGDTLLHKAIPIWLQFGIAENEELAMEEERRAEMVALALIVAWPEAAKEKDAQGDIPLNIAAKNLGRDKGRLESVVLALIKAWLVLPGFFSFFVFVFLHSSSNLSAMCSGTLVACG